MIWEVVHHDSTEVTSEYTSPVNGVIDGLAVGTSTVTIEASLNSRLIVKKHAKLLYDT